VNLSECSWERYLHSAPEESDRRAKEHSHGIGAYIFEVMTLELFNDFEVPLTHDETNADGIEVSARSICQTSF
jgi:hypothetical protein